MAGVSDNDELISQFMAFTGSADAAKAASYLEMSGNDVETAVGLYMEHEQTGGGGGFGGVASASGAIPMMGGGHDDIRAPDATRTMRLMDDPMGMPTDPSYHMMNALMEEQLHQSAFASPGGLVDARAVVNAAIAATSGDSDDDEKENDDYVYDDDDDVEDMNGAVVAPPPRLSDMFASPTHLIHKAGGFQGARAMAKDTRRWLLVNIQRDSEFSSHALNRDVWRDELVENLIREGFIFWQQMDTTPEGITYVERYQVREFPHIGFVDPRTGRLLFRKEGWTQQNPLTAESFAEIAMDFCSRNSFSKPPQAPRPGGLPAKRPMQEMSEAEQLEAAMKASMADHSGAMETKDDSELLPEVVDITGDDDDSKPTAQPTQQIPPSANEELLSTTVPEEPASGGGKVVFRMADGKRVVRSFSGSDPVKIIYAFVAQSNEEAKGGREFILMAGFPPRDLRTSFDDTIDAAKLSGEAITMRWK